MAARPAKGQGLADVFRERQVLRAAQQVPARRVPVLVDPLLDAGEQVGRVLCFVEDDRWPERFQESTGVSLGRRPYVPRLKGDVAVGCGKEAPEESRLSGLAGTGEHDGREVGDRPLQHRLRGSFEVVHAASRLKWRSCILNA